MLFGVLNRDIGPLEFVKTWVLVHARAREQCVCLPSGTFGALKGLRAPAVKSLTPLCLVATST